MSHKGKIDGERQREGGVKKGNQVKEGDFCMNTAHSPKHYASRGKWILIIPSLTHTLYVYLSIFCSSLTHTHTHFVTQNTSSSSASLTHHLSLDHPPPPSPSTCPTIILPSSPPTAARAFLSLAYWTKAKPLCTEQPTILPYLEKMASTSALVTSRVLRLPMKTRELRERGSVLLVTLLAIRLLVVGERLKEGDEKVYNPKFIKNLPKQIKQCLCRLTTAFDE